MPSVTRVETGFLVRGGNCYKLLRVLLQTELFAVVSSVVADTSQWYFSILPASSPGLQTQILL